MKLSKRDIAHMEEVGSLGGEPVFHIRTKGGFNLIVLQKNSGMSVISSGSHRASAKAHADQLEKGIEWYQDLFKSEDGKPEEKEPVLESSPQAHKDTADFHAKLSWHYHNKLDHDMSFIDKHENHMSGRWHEDVALKHYQMAGFTRKDAEAQYKSKRSDHAGVSEDSLPPYHASKLEDAYRMKHGKTFQGIKTSNPHTHWAD